ncbi:MAG: acyloxyacyl hydrolase, partial [Bacteroidia bacterium]|nr:acyloxyacyl hydrolase [Bacteroidia bacterium]
HRYPTYGVSLLWFDGGNLTQIGYARGISPFAEFVVFKTKKIEANFHLATGIASLTKPFDLVENQKNVAIGSSISGVMQGILNIQYFFHPNLSAHVGLCITHFSNSNIQLPNYGLNYPHIRFGINTFFHEKKPIPQQIRPNPQPSKHRLQVHVAIATKQMEEIENKRFFPRMLSIKYARTIGQTGLFTGAVELFNDPSQLVRRYQKDTVSNLFSSFDIAFVPGYEILFGRLSIVMNIGVYAFRKNPVYTVTYQRLGIRYEPFDRVYCLVALKTHFAQSDFIEWGIGINLYKKKSKKAD